MYNGNQFVWRAPISPREKLVLLFLCETADYYGRADFSIPLISSVCGLSEDDTAHILYALENRKILVIGASDRKKRDIEPWISAMIAGCE
jgi:hypothetical protein